MRPDELQSVTPLADSTSAMSPFGFPPNQPLTTMAGAKPPRVPRLNSLTGSNGETSSEFIPPQLSEREMNAISGRSGVNYRSQPRNSTIDLSSDSHRILPKQLSLAPIIGGNRNRIELYSS